MTPRFCKDCKFILVKNDAYDLAKCSHPKALKPMTEFLVSGKREAPEYLYAASMRIGTCGEEGKLFEARVS